MENSMEAPEKLKIEVSYDLTGYNKGTCTPMFIAALFTIVKLWK
jgi:hypothetical protein